MKKIVLLILIMTLIFSFTAMTVSAQETTINNNEESVYTSDLFYLYQYYLLNDPFLETFEQDISNLTSSVYDEYKNSLAMYGTAFSYALSNATSLSEICKVMLDRIGVSNYRYTDALDRANELVITMLLKNGFVNEVSKLEDTASGLIDIMGDFCKHIENISKETDVDIYDCIDLEIDYLIEQGILGYIGTGVLGSIASALKNSTNLEILGDSIKISKGIFMAIVLEDYRFSIIDSVLETQTTDSVLKDGMTRLKNQVNENFATYFLKNYIDNMMLEKICNFIGDKITDALDLNRMGLIMQICGDVVFDIVLDAPDFGDVMAFQVLCAYSSDMNGVIEKDAQKFTKGPFTSNEIFDYKDLFVMYSVISNATIQLASDIASSTENFEERFNSLFSLTIGCGLPDLIKNTKEMVTIMYGDESIEVEVESYSLALAIYYIRSAFESGQNSISFKGDAGYVHLDTTRFCLLEGILKTSMSCTDYVEAFNEKYKGVNIYDSHLRSVKETIASIPYEERVKIEKSTYSNWTYEIKNGIRLKLQSDNIDLNCVYATQEGFLGNFILGNDLMVQDSCNVKFDGTLKMLVNSNFYNYGKTVVTGDVSSNCTTFRNDGTLCVNGTFTAAGQENTKNVLINNGEMFLNNVDFSVTNWLTTQYGANSKSYISGNIKSARGYKFSETIVLNGTTTQNIYGLSAYNLIVENETDIIYRSNLGIYGDIFYINESVNIYYGNYSACIYSSPRLSIGDYGHISIMGEVQLKDNVKSNIFYVSKALIIPEGYDVTIDGNVETGVESNFYNYGKTVVTGDVSSNGTTFRNDGTLCVNGTFTAAGQENTKNVLINNGEMFLNNVDFSVTNWLTTQYGANSKSYISGNIKSARGYKFSETIVLNGTTTQNIYGLSAYNLIVENETDIIYRSNLGIYGDIFYINESVNIYYGNYSACIYSSPRLSIGDYGHISIMGEVQLKDNVKSNIFYVSKALIIPEGYDVTIDGNVETGVESNFYNYGQLSVLGEFRSLSQTFQNDGNLFVKGKFSAISQNDEDTLLNNGEMQFNSVEFDVNVQFGNNSICYIKNALTIKRDCIISDIVVLNGTEKQTLRGFAANVLILENTSSAGVVFTSAVNVFELFNHKGNKFTLYNNGVNSTFADYDSDGMKDHVDQLPTVRIEDGVWYEDGWVVGCDNDITVADLRADTIGIKNGAFSDCLNLYGVLIYKAIEYIEENVFINCPRLSYVSYAGCSGMWEKIDVGENNYELNELLKYQNHIMFRFEKHDINQCVSVCECGVIIDYHDHIWGNEVIVEGSSHLENGSKTYTCKNCKGTRVEIIEPVTGHTFDIIETSVNYRCSDATCISPALYYYSCACGAASEITFEVGEALGHSFTHYISNGDETNSEDGTKTAKCDRCDSTDTIVNVGSALGFKTEFLNAMSKISYETTTQRYTSIGYALTVYNQMNENEQAEVSNEYKRLSLMVSFYNMEARKANQEHEKVVSSVLYVGNLESVNEKNSTSYSLSQPTASKFLFVSKAQHLTKEHNVFVGDGHKAITMKCRSGKEE